MAGRILVAEDSPTQGEFLREGLAGFGFDVTLAKSGEGALERFLAEPFDLVLSDVVMPGMDGYELCRRIKGHDSDVPVVLLTSLTDPLEIAHALEAGADNFLRKPYEIDELGARLETMLYHRGMRADGGGTTGLDVFLGGKRFMIAAERQQLVDLLISSFEDLVASNRLLRQRDDDLTAAHRQLRAQLAVTELERRRVAAVLQAVPHPMVIVDGDGIITDVTDALCALTGRARDALIGVPAGRCLGFVDGAGNPMPVDQQPLAAALGGDRHPKERGTGFDLFVEHIQGARLAVIARAAPVFDDTGRPTAAVGSLVEIGALAAHDPVTKLANHTLFTDRVARGLAASAGTARVVAVLAIVPDRFSRVREGLPPATFDHLLSSFADRLRTFVPEGLPDPSGLASAAYFGDGVFAFLLPGLEEDLDAVRMAQALHELLSRQRFAVHGGIALTLTVSIGVAVAGPGAKDPVSLVTSAVAAARRAVAAGGNRVETADPAVDVRAGEWLRLTEDLRVAVKSGQLVLHYQPKWDLRRERPAAVEALVRWNHPQRGLVPPSEFIPLARDSGLVVPLGWWVLREACRQVADWRQRFPEGRDIVVMVNLDVQQLADPDVADRVAEVLREVHLDAGALTLEITESGVLDDAEMAVTRLRQLKALGIGLAVDDFGTGYSSLVQLRRFPVDVLKIDRSFIAGMTGEAEDDAIVAATIGLGQSLGLATVAEGVETGEQVSRLRALDCDFAQGYRWSRPLSAQELARWWVAHAGTPDVGTGDHP